MARKKSFLQRGDSLHKDTGHEDVFSWFCPLMLAIIYSKTNFISFYRSPPIFIPWVFIFFFPLSVLVRGGVKFIRVQFSELFQELYVCMYAYLYSPRLLLNWLFDIEGYIFFLSTFPFFWLLKDTVFVILLYNNYVHIVGIQ